MALATFNPAVFNPFLLWADVAVKTTEMLLSSGQVIGTRVGRMARAGANPSARDRREFALMSSEKVKAATQSGLAVAARLQAANWQLYARAWQQWLASMTAFSSLASSRSMGDVLSRQYALFNALGRSGRTHGRISTDVARLASAALKPVHAASTANARRLARVRTRSAKAKR
jgi:hypothetical protein